MARGEAGQRDWPTTNEKILAQIVGAARRDANTRFLVAVQCRRKHALERRLKQVREIELVNYWEL
ncbi:MAG: hypothetical protein HY741_23015 [Chloroflexi bacterium]|nr:hypothetical protein [Chloroflexota bacterium]